MSNFAPFSKKSTSFSVSVDLVSSIACASSFSAMYSIQAWFSGTLPCLSWKSATKALEAGVSRLWCHRSEEHTSELQSLMRISYAVFCLKKKKKQNTPCIIKYYHNKNQLRSHNKLRQTNNI